VTIGPEAVWRQSKENTIRIVVYAAQGEECLNFTLSSDNNAVSYLTEACNQISGANQEVQSAKLAEVIGDIAYYRLNPSSLRYPSAISFRRLAETGEGLATFLDDLLRRDRGAFIGFEKSFYSRFPYYETIVIDKTKIRDESGSFSQDAFVLKLRPVKGAVLSVESVSDGVMLSMAYLALAASPNPPAILLIEEPENGIHPGSLKDVVATLRDLAEKKKVQVVLTTHSPYLLDLVEPEDVRVFSKDEEGAVHAKKLSDFEDVEDMKKDFMSGEIWTILSKTEKI
jgi:predicted ATPase